MVNQGDEIRLREISGGEAKNVVAPFCRCVLEGQNEQLGQTETAFRLFASEHQMSCRTILTGGMLTLELDGVSAHASLPEQGVNAISYMILFLADILPHSPFLCGYRDLIAAEYDAEHPAESNVRNQYGTLTLNIGLIALHGNEAEAAVDIRYPITVDFTAYAKEIQKRFAAKQIAMNDIRIGKALYVDPAVFALQTRALLISVTGRHREQACHHRRRHIRQKFRSCGCFRD